MSSRAAAEAAKQNVPDAVTGSPVPGRDRAAQPASYDAFFQIQRTLGNQAVRRLFESRVLHAKLRVSQPGDADEIEADRVANQVVSSSHAPGLQRKCSCSGGSSCAKCSDDESVIHRSAGSQMLRSSRPSIQRSPASESSGPSLAGATAPAAHSADRGPARAHPLIVEDDSPTLARGQMKKSEFIETLRSATCATADAVLASVGHSTKSCPYIEKWLSHYSGKPSEHIERALLKYAPESARARSARELISIVTARVHSAALTWAKTGKVTGIPEDMAHELPGGGLLGGGGFLSGIAGAALGFLGGSSKGKSEGGGVQRKARDRDSGNDYDAASVKSQLGAGHSLDSRVQTQMSSAFGYDFSAVRVHTDSQARRLSDGLTARAFTIGSDIAFGAGEYKPGTLIGDALIAHELAHVVQQQGGNDSGAPQSKGHAGHDALEEEADLAATRAMIASRDGNVKRDAASGNARSWLPVGLRLQRCGSDETRLNETRLNLKDMTLKQRKEFVQRHFEKKDRTFADRILEDIVQSSDILNFKDEEELKTEIFKRMTTSRVMQKTQDLFGNAFEYPNKPKAKECLPGNEKGDKINPRVNKAAEKYWGPVQYEKGSYYFELSGEGKQNAYQALKTLFTPQNSICNMTLIHCDYLASVVHFLTFAETIGPKEFDLRVKSGKIEMRLTYYGFQYLEDRGAFKSAAGVSLQEVRPPSENDLIIGDHVIFWNHRAYDDLNQKIGNAWRLENAILIDKKGKEDIFEGHGSGIKTKKGLLQRLAHEFNVVIKMAQSVIAKIRNKDPKKSAAGQEERETRFPNLQEESGVWKIHTRYKKSYDVKTVDEENPETNPDMLGLRDPDDPSRLYWVKRPVESK
jgi:Domain of unknown function (DUF4157)/Protein-glutamine gamma-glutamyltransferase